MVSPQQLAQNRVKEAVDRLNAEFEGIVETETIARLVSDSFESYRTARVKDFVPLLVYRSIREYLLSVAKGERLEKMTLVAP